MIQRNRMVEWGRTSWLDKLLNPGVILDQVPCRCSVAFDSKPSSDRKSADTYEVEVIAGIMV